MLSQPERSPNQTKGSNGNLHKDDEWLENLSDSAQTSTGPQYVFSNSPGYVNTVYPYVFI